MICFVDMEHESLTNVFSTDFLNDERGIAFLGEWAALKFRFEEITGQACLLQHHTQITEAKLQRWGIRALVLSGCRTAWDEYNFDRFQDLFCVIRETDIPLIGLCGGHQAIGFAYDTPSAAMGPLPEGAEDPNPDVAPGMMKEYGFTHVDVLQLDPLFEGLGNRPLMFEAHWWEMQEVPPGFTLLASNDVCRIQAIKHQSRLLYGVQFHPEFYTKEHQDGRVLLENFFCLAGVIK
jgi:GMP synthase-like glutamine amidotransferase